METKNNYTRPLCEVIELQIEQIVLTVSGSIDPVENKPSGWQ